MPQIDICFISSALRLVFWDNAFWGFITNVIVSIIDPVRGRKLNKFILFGAFTGVRPWSPVLEVVMVFKLTEGVFALYEEEVESRKGKFIWLLLNWEVQFCHGFLHGMTNIILCL